MPTLPSEFADLERFADWSLEAEKDRYAKRLASSMEELQDFYDVALPRLADALAYLDKYDLDELPDDALNLLRLTYSFVTVSFSVEAWHQPRVPDSGASMVYAVVEPAV